tara:strand:+ start:542 stop:763 length:222 start_codon:yes stop_codon:yes gene_type:complete
MATVSNWIDHLSASEVQGSIYPGVGSEGVLVIIAILIWIGWHVISSKQESNKMDKIARKRPSSNDWKNNITDG